MSVIEIEGPLDQSEAGKLARAHPYDVIVGRNVRLMRMQQGMSQDQVARKLGYTFQALQRQEKGINRISASCLILISEVLKCEPAELLRGAGNNRGIARMNQIEDFLPAEIRMVMNLRALARDADRVAIMQLVRSLGGGDDA